MKQGARNHSEKKFQNFRSGELANTSHNGWICPKDTDSPSAIIWRHRTNIKPNLTACTSLLHKTANSLKKPLLKPCMQNSIAILINIMFCFLFHGKCIIMKPFIHRNINLILFLLKILKINVKNWKYINKYSSIKIWLRKQLQ